MVKRMYFVYTVVFLVLLGFIYFSYFLKQNTISVFMGDSKKISAYSQWGYETRDFEKMYLSLIKEVKARSFIVFTFYSTSFKIKHDNILRLTQAGYATEVTRLKGEVQSRLSYLRERVKNSSLLSQVQKQIHSDSFEIVAGETFETNSDINGYKKALRTLEEQDRLITKEVETVRKEAIRSELINYKTTCEQLLSYFTEKNSAENKTLALNCITSADKLMGPGYEVNGADFVEALSRERVFSLAQKASQAKQQLMQEEQYTLAAQKKEEEKLTLVPPSPRQDGKVIVVNLGLQRLYAYENGISLFSVAVPITTGKYGFETVTGEFAVYLKELQHKMVSPFPGIYYDDVVNYWMPFYLGYGLHDAPWRSVYGTQDYVSIGSHGCVNIPLKDTIVLYNWAEVGTRVIVI